MTWWPLDDFARAPLALILDSRRRKQRPSLMPSVVLITLLLATTAPQTTAPVGEVPAGVDADITVSPAVDDDASDVMAAVAVAPELRKVSGPAVVDNVLLRGAIAGGTGLVVGYGVGLITAFGGAFTSSSPRLASPPRS